MKARNRIVRCLGNDDGSVSLLAAVIVTALVALAGAVVVVATAVIDIHRAQVGADMAAVAGAHAHYRGEDPCTTATEVAQWNEVRLDECIVIGMDVTVRVGAGARVARARAGPAD